MATLRLPRWTHIAVVAAIVAIGAALITIVWLTHRNVTAARATLLRGVAAEAVSAVHGHLTSPGDATIDERVAAALDDSRAQGVRYIAIVDHGRVIAEAGTPVTTREVMLAWFATAGPLEPVAAGGRVRVGFRRPPGPPRARHHGPPEVVLEIDTAVADELDTFAGWSLAIGLTAAGTLLALALALARWSLAHAARVRADEQARHLANLGQMSAVLAHEIRNPLASLKGNAQLLARALPADDRSRARADRVVDEAVRLEQLTTDLLAFANTGALRRQDTDPAALVRAVLDERGSDRLVLHASAAPSTWSLDPDRLRQVVANLVDNALQMSEGTIDVTLDRAADQLRLAVRDRGPGLGPDAARIFEPFFTTRTRGTGLGLAVCQRLVELHGGTISARNADGGGAEFTIVIPARSR